MTAIKSEYFIDEVTGQRYVMSKLGGSTNSNGGNAANVLAEVTNAIKITGNLGSTQYMPMLGASGSLVAIPASSQEYVVDLSSFGSTDIYVAIIASASTVTFTATVTYSQDGGASYQHGSNVPINGVAGNSSAVLLKKDKFAHITLSESAAGETIWAYVIGRDIS